MSKDQKIQATESSAAHEMVLRVLMVAKLLSKGSTEPVKTAIGTMPDLKSSTRSARKHKN